MRKRLSAAEREIRSGRGIPLKRWWPIPILFVTWIWASGMEQFLESCTGFDLPAPHRRDYVGLLVRMAIAVPCSPLLLKEGFGSWLLFAAMWGPIPFAVANLFWSKRHKAYWDEIRAREKIRRAEKRNQKAENLETLDDQT